MIISSSIGRCLMNKQRSALKSQISARISGNYSLQTRLLTRNDLAIYMKSMKSSTDYINYDMIFFWNKHLFVSGQSLFSGQHLFIVVVCNILCCITMYVALITCISTFFVCPFYLLVNFSRGEIIFWLKRVWNSQYRVQEWKRKRERKKLKWTLE